MSSNFSTVINDAENIFCLTYVLAPTIVICSMFMGCLMNNATFWRQLNYNVNISYLNDCRILLTFATIFTLFCIKRYLLPAVVWVNFKLIWRHNNTSKCYFNSQCFNNENRVLKTVKIPNKTYLANALTPSTCIEKKFVD